MEKMKLFYFLSAFISPPRPSLSLFSLTQQLSIGKIINVWNVLRLATYKTTMDIVEIRVEIETCADEGYTHNYVVIKRKEKIIKPKKETCCCCC
jgi:hypothetical protein